MERIAPGQVVHLLDEFFVRHLPIARYLKLRSIEYTGAELALAIDLEPSLNDKLTAFGGSLYCLCVMNAWGMVYLQARQRGINPNVVVTRAEIDYLTPVDAAVIIARCSGGDPAMWDDTMAAFQSRGKARVVCSSTVHVGSRAAVRLRGEYALIGPAPS